MSQNLRFRNQFYTEGDQKAIRDGDTSGVDVQGGQEITIYSTQVPADKVYYWGYGSRDANDSPNSFVFADLVADGSGSGTDGDLIKGDLVLAITDSTQEDTLAKRNVGSIEGLSDAATSDRTERPVLGELAPVATEDRHLEIRIRATSAVDGYHYDPTDSDMILYRGEANV